MAEVQPKFNFDNVDLDAIDPDRIPLGTCAQDCSQIAAAFERGSHSTASEPAVFATLTRTLQNNKRLATTNADALETYLSAPQETAANATAEAASFGADTLNNGASAQTGHGLQSLNIGTQEQSAMGDSFGTKLLQQARDCIPCGLRMAAFLELHPNVNLLGALEAHLTGQLQVLSDIAGIFTNFDSYGDFCSLLNLLSFMCIPDLQRIIATLMALLILDVPTLDGLISMLQALIVPIFAPILMGITSLLDQFSVIVTNPLECVIDAINLQLQKLGFQLDPSSPIEQASAGISTGLQQLQSSVTEAKQRIEDKLTFYIKQVEAMMGELGSGDSAYIAATIRKLQIVRMIAFIIAMITAISRGHAACSSTKPAGLNDIDNFFQTFLNPTAPFDLWVDDDGQLHVDEKVPEQAETLPNTENVLQFEGEPLLETVAIQVGEVAATLSTPVRTIVPCSLELQTGDIDKVNQWVSELNKTP